MVDVAQNEKIRIFSYSEVNRGAASSAILTVPLSAARVCERGCMHRLRCCAPKNVRKRRFPTSLTSAWITASAIYIPFAQAVPKVADHRPQPLHDAQNGKCGVCSKVCSAGAIDYKAKDEFKEKYGAIVVATGFNPISMEKFDEFAYSQSKDVITSLELERLMNAAGPTGGHASAPLRRQSIRTRSFSFSAWVHAVRLRRKGQGILLQNLLYVHRKARNA